MAQAEEPGANPGLSRNCDRGATPAATAVAGASGDPGARNSGHRSRLRARNPGRATVEDGGTAPRTGHYGGGTAFPFAAIAGMDDLKLALLLNAVSPAIGGVLVRGEKGTAKSTLVRGLAALLPPVDVVAGCRFCCDPDAPDPGCPDGPHPARQTARRGAGRAAARPGWPSCRSAPPRTGWPGRWTSSGR